MAAKWKLPAGVTWKQKLEQTHPNHGKIVPVPPGMRKRFGTGTMLIPKPRAVDALLRKVRKGKLATSGIIRARLAADAGADHACPLTTGIFIRIAAEAALEAQRAGQQRITPFWRIVRENGALNDKFPGGTRAQARKLREEGFTIEPGRGGKAPRVRDYQKYLMALCYISP
ncbi:MAG: hypothetical protein ABIG44_02720 [Planctomycetota bacterium]